MKDTLSQGPIMKRSCTDCICCLLFVLFIGGFIAGSGYGVMYGDPMKLTIGWDSDRNGCGITPGFEDYKYLYWPNPPDASLLTDLAGGADASDIVDGIMNILSQGTCVKECPLANSQPVQCIPTTSMADPNSAFI